MMVDDINTTTAIITEFPNSLPDKYNHIYHENMYMHVRNVSST